MLTTKASASGTLIALYSGNCRVGYLTKAQHPLTTWMWNLNVLQPHGGSYFGRMSTQSLALACAQMSFDDWTNNANLRSST